MSNNYTISSEGVSYIQGWEKCSLSAYYDNIGYSIGYGHFLGKQDENNNPPLDNISQATADALFLGDILPLEKIINKSGLTLTQNQFDSLVDLGYNAGNVPLKQAILYLQRGDSNSFTSYVSGVHIHDHEGNIIANNQQRRNDLLSVFNFNDANDPDYYALTKNYLGQPKQVYSGINPGYFAVAVILAYILTKIIDKK